MIDSRPNLKDITLVSMFRMHNGRLARSMQPCKQQICIYNHRYTYHEVLVARSRQLKALS